MRAPAVRVGSGGSLDLLFHPMEATFTLLQLHEMLEDVGLEVIGVFFNGAAPDRHARTIFRDVHENDPRMLDLRNWHQLEQRLPQLFGRMHVVYCRLKKKVE